MILKVQQDNLFKKTIILLCWLQTTEAQKKPPLWMVPK